VKWDVQGKGTGVRLQGKQKKKKTGFNKGPILFHEKKKRRGETGGELISGAIPKKKLPQRLRNKEKITITSFSGIAPGRAAIQSKKRHP